MTAAKGECRSAHIHTHSMHGRVGWLVCNQQAQACLPACNPGAVSHLQRHCSIRDVCAATPACQQRHQSVTPVPSRQKQARLPAPMLAPVQPGPMHRCRCCWWSPANAAHLSPQHLCDRCCRAATHTVQGEGWLWEPRGGCTAGQPHSISISTATKQNTVLRAALPHQLLARGGGGSAGAVCSTVHSHLQQCLPHSDPPLAHLPRSALRSCSVVTTSAPMPLSHATVASQSGLQQRQSQEHQPRQQQQHQQLLLWLAAPPRQPTAPPAGA